MFFSSKDPSKHWPPARVMPLKLDLSTRSLNGIAAGAPFDALREFGRPDNKNPFTCEDFSYHALGFEVGGEHGKITDFAFMFDTSHIRKAKPCEGLTISAPGRPAFVVKRSTMPADLKAGLGEPTEIETDEDCPDEPDLTYRIGNLELLFCFDEEGLVTLDVDPAQ